MIIYNWIGAGMGCLSLFVGWFVSSVLLSEASSKTQVIVFGLTSGSMSIAVDIGYRTKVGGGHLFLPVAGGNVFFIPIWIWGIILIIAVLMNAKD